MCQGQCDPVYVGVGILPYRKDVCCMFAVVRYCILVREHLCLGLCVSGVLVFCVYVNTCL